MVGDSAKLYIDSVGRVKTWKHRLSAALPFLSVLVVIFVFWCLKLTGITLAGEAFCGMTEHVHSEACIASSCELIAHTHTSDCYSDINADVETAEDWEATLPDLSSEPSLLNRITAIAASQRGYTESERNFIVDSDGVRHGYTRYGKWYGNPYGDWSAMFVSFCLSYAGQDAAPLSSGAETMRSEWESYGFCRDVNSYTPLEGDLLFLDNNQNGSADAVAIVISVNSIRIVVIEGDLDNAVVMNHYFVGDPVMMSYGVSSIANVPIITPPEDEAATDETSSSELTMSGDAAITEAAVDMADAGTTFAASGPKKIAQTTAFDHSLFTDTNSFVVYTSSGSDYYAFDGNGNAVPITIEADGGIYADIDDPSLLLWSFTQSGGDTSYLIRNVSTGRYMHAYPNNGSGVTTAGAYTSTLVTSGNDLKIRSNSEYARLDVESGKFVMTQSLSSAAAYEFGVISNCAVWLDGTNGGMRSLLGSPDVCYTVESGSTMTLPTEWQSPPKYGYTLGGWYDVTHAVYYPAGSDVVITGNTVFYAYWTVATYDIGEFNASVSDTVSTNHIINTAVFDYNYLFNVLSQNVTVTANASGHTETWTHVASGTVPYNNAETIDFVFVENDSGGKLTMANSRNSNNKYESNVPIKPGIYNNLIENTVFGTYNSFDPATGSGIIGKHYLGSGDHLFQYMSDPNSEHYGYYYYDSDLHAASYNQSEQRFYVYDYLARTSDSAGASGSDQYADFLPFNSPYANTNGNNIPTYYYDGANGEYSGIPHFQYDIEYDSGNGSADNVSANVGFGMSMEMDFYLPDVPGTLDASGQTGNRDLYGNEMHYKFTGDDDLWVLVDGEVVLDLGGIHGRVAGDINFSTGIVTANGVQTNTLYDLAAGDHTLTILYLERGSSQSNCAMYFNLAPRFSLDIAKEDVLTREVLNGAEFTVYTDEACTSPAVLWDSEQAYEADMPSKSTFRVVDGVAKLWGLSPSKNYYIKETKAPDAEGYERAEGIICLTFDIKGIATFEILIEEESAGDGISGGYTVFDYHVDTENQAAYLTVTNAQTHVKEVTSVQAVKIWNDTEDHSSNYVSVYLTVKDADGTVRRIREAILGEENNWTYTWTNLPKYAADGVTPVDYGIEESYTPGYSSEVEQVDSIVIETAVWEEAYTFIDGQKYLLRTSSGYLAATNSSSQTLTWIDEETAKALYNSEGSLSAWTATVSGSNVKLTNSNGQILSYNGSGSRYFFVTKSSTNYQSFVVTDAGSGLRLYYRQNNWTYRYMSTLNSSGYLSATTNSNNALIFTPMVLSTETTEIEVEDIAYTVTNTPLEAETSLRVTKYWDTGLAVNVYYDNLQVTVKLYANGKDTGRTLTLDLKNSWTDVFRGLPYADENGNPISYTVAEATTPDDWEVFYGEIVTVSGTVPTYETTVTNVYRYGHGYQLPETGGIGRTPLILCGLTMMAGSLVCGYVLKRKRERRRGE